MAYIKWLENGLSSLISYERFFKYLLPIISFLIWFYVVATQELILTDLGIIESLSVWFIAVLLLQISFFYVLLKNEDRKILWVHTCLIIIYLFFTITLLEGTPRMNNSWDKYGFTDYILRNNAINPREMWYHNWPSTHIFSATLVKITNIPSDTYMLYFPIMVHMLLLPVLVVVFRRFFDDHRKVWIAVWVFYYANWVNQDHFTAQHFGLLLLVIDFAILMMIFHQKDPKNQYILIGLLLITSLITILAHLLTTIVYVLMLIVIGLRYKRHLLMSKRTLLYISSIVAIIFSMVVFFASGILSYWINQYNFSLDILWRSIADYTSRVLEGNAGHRVVVITRIIYTTIFILLALIGTLSLMHTDDKKKLLQKIRSFILEKYIEEKRMVTNMWLLIVCAAVPIIFITYGGEILQRFFLFSILPVSILIGINFNKKRFIAITIVLLLLATPFYIIAHYGNERADYFTRGHINGVYHFYDHVSFDVAYIAPHSAARSKFREKYYFASMTNESLDSNLNRTKYVWYTNAYVEQSTYFYNDFTTPIEFRNRLEQSDYDKIYANKYFDLYYKDID